jgi:WD40 repeat protein/serine/threonine protein kinase
MRSPLACDEDLVRRLPLPLAQLYRRAHNAKTALERHHAAYYLWEAALKLLASAAVVEYAERAEHDPQLAERLENLSRPAVGHWWEFVRLLVPVLAESGDARFGALRELLLGKARDDLPRAAGLDTALAEALEGRGGARSRVRLTELFDRLVRYRNRELGHGASGQRSDDFYENMGRALLAGLGELLGRLDVLAGRRLLYVAEVRGRASGDWLVERYELTGEAPRRLASVELPATDACRLPRAKSLYLGTADEPSAPGGEAPPAPPRLLRPLVVHDEDTGEVFFLNGRRGRRRAEYLCYSSGRVLDRDELGAEQRELLARVLGVEVDGAAVEAWAARSQAEEAPAPADPAAPRRPVGEFELLSRIGRGGMGVVYRAWQPSLGRQVALKLLLRAGDPKAEARFAREIRALGRVEHPNLVKVFTSGSDGEQWFYAMELVEGTDLASVCGQLAGSAAPAVGAEDWQRALTSACEESRTREEVLSDDASGPPPAPAAPPAPAPAPAALRSGHGHLLYAVELVRQVAEAAHALHEARVVHRDIKPGNIMVLADGQHAVLMDLGLAQLADEDEGRLTRTRQFVGTLRYASPEQVLAAAPLDRRSDVYSLGATLYELLTLRPLFGATDQTAPSELMLKILSGDPERPRRLNPRVPADLEAVVLKCLEKDRTRRYATAAELAEDLARWQRGEPVHAQPPTVRYVLGKYARRHRSALALAAALVLVALVGAGAAFYRIDAERRRAEANEREARHNLYDARMVLARQAWEQADVARVLELLDGQPADLRGPDWDALWSFCHRDRFTLRGRAAEIPALAVSPDGATLAAGRVDGTVEVWDLVARPRRVRHTLTGHTHKVLGVAFSPDGKTLASASGDQTVRLWDPATGKEKGAPLAGHQRQVLAVAFSPDGKTLATGSADATVKLWDPGTGREKATLKGHEAAVVTLAFFADGRLLATAGDDETVRFWDPADGREVGEPLRGHTGVIRSVALSPDGKTLASGSDDATVRLWDVAARAPLGEPLRGHTASAWSVAFSPDGQTVASGSLDNTVRLWDVATGEERFTFKGHTAGVLHVAFTPDGRTLVSAGRDRTVRGWDPASGAGGPPLEGRHTRPVTALAFSPDGRTLASAGQDWTVRLWEAPTGRALGRPLEHPNSVPALAYSPDGRLVAAAGRDGVIRLWEGQGAARRERMPPLTGHVGGVLCLAFSPNGRRLASGGADGTVRLWDPARGEAVLQQPVHDNWILGLAFSPDGNTLASAGADALVKLLDPATLEVRATFAGHTRDVRGVAFSRDGKTLASGANDGTIKLWDVAARAERATLRGHTGWVRSLAFTPDGLLVSTGGKRDAPGEVKLWRLDPAPRELDDLQGHGGTVNAVALTRDGQTLATGDDKGIVKLWDLGAVRRRVPEE